MTSLSRIDVGTAFALLLKQAEVYERDEDENRGGAHVTEHLCLIGQFVRDNLSRGTEILPLLLAQVERLALREDYVPYEAIAVAAHAGRWHELQIAVQAARERAPGAAFFFDWILDAFRDDWDGTRVYGCGSDEERA